MNPRATAGLVAIFTILAGVTWWFELREAGPVSKPAPGQASIFDLKVDEISRLEVVDGGSRIVVERGADGWRVVDAPAIDEADSRRIDNAVGQIAKLTASRKLEDASDLASYGLGAPQTRIVLSIKEGAVQELLIGTKTPDQASYYVKRSDSPTIFVTSTFTLTDLVRWPADPPRPRPTPAGGLPAPAGPSFGVKPGG